MLNRSNVTERPTELMMSNDISNLHTTSLTLCDPTSSLTEFPLDYETMHDILYLHPF